MKAESKRMTDQITALVNAELQTFRDPKLLQALSRFLVSPHSYCRVWDYSMSQEKYEYWMIAESKNYDYGIIYRILVLAHHVREGLCFSQKITSEPIIVGIRILRMLLLIRASLTNRKRSIQFRNFCAQLVQNQFHHLPSRTEKTAVTMPMAAFAAVAA